MRALTHHASCPFGLPPYTRTALAASSTSLVPFTTAPPILPLRSVARAFLTTLVPRTTSRHLFLALPSAALRPSSRCVHRRPKTNASGAAPRAAARASSISAAATRSATSPPLTTQRKVERQHTGLCTHLDTTPSRHGSLQCDCKAVEGSANWRRPMGYRHPQNLVTFVCGPSAGLLQYLVTPANTRALTRVFSSLVCLA